MLQWEHSAILSTFIKLRFVIKIFVLSIFEWPFYTGFTVWACMSTFFVMRPRPHSQFTLFHLINSLYETEFNLSYDTKNNAFNPFMPNGISHPYQLGESISNLRVVG